MSATRPHRVTLDDVLSALETDEHDTGFCLACGTQAFGITPDARASECEECGEHKVYGAEELLLMVA